MSLKLILYIIIILIALIILFLAGPRVPIDQTIYLLELPADLDNYLAAAEAQIPGLRPNTEKTIIWANPETKNKTALSII